MFSSVDCSLDVLAPPGALVGLSVGGLSVGGLSVGGLSVGGLSVGGLSVGGLSVGGLSVGGLSVGGFESSSAGEPAGFALLSSPSAGSKSDHF